MADIKINVNTVGGEDALNTLGGIKKQIKDLKSQALSIGEGGKGFKELTQQANELQDKLDDLKDSSKSLQGTGIEKLQSSFSLLTDSFKNADFGKAKIAFQGLGTAMKAVPIFLIIEGVMKLLETFDVFGKVTAFITDLIYAFTDAIGLTSKAAEKQSKAVIESQEKQQAAITARYDSEIKLAQAAGQETEYLEIAKLKALEDSIAIQVKSLHDLQTEKGKLNDEEQKQYEELQNKLLVASGDRRAKELAAEQKFRKELGEYRNFQEDVSESLRIAKMSDREKEIYNIKKQAKDRLAELDKKEVFNYQTTGAQIEAQLKSNAETRKQIEEVTAIEIGKINSKYAKEAADKRKAKEDKEKADAASFAAYMKKSMEDVQKDINETAKKDAEDKGKIVHDTQLKWAKQTQTEIKETEEETAKVRMAIIIQNITEITKQVNQYTQAIGSTLNQVVGVFSALMAYQAQEREQDTKERQEKLDADISNLEAAKDIELAKEGLTAEQKNAINYKYAMQEYELKLLEYNRNTEVKKKAFEQDKKLKIAQTVISTITGVVSAVTGMISAVPGPVGIVLGALAGAAVAAMGAIQVATISKQKFDAGSPPAAPKLTPPSDNSGSIGGGGSSQQGPDLYAINGDTNTGQGGPNGQRQAQPQKVYVVSQEVTSSQNMNAVIERRASF